MDKLKDVFYKKIEKESESLIDRDLSSSLTLIEIADEVGENEFADAILEKHSIKKCKYCGRPFIAKNKKRLFCSKDCQRTGLRKERERDPITKEMDHARRVHLYRRSSSGKTKKAMKAYDKWLSFAKEAERSCRDGEISVEAFAMMIGTEYKDDWPSRR